MAKKTQTSEQRYPKPRDEGEADMPPADRPDQIEVDHSEQAEEIDIFAKDEGGRPVVAQDGDADLDRDTDEPAERIESREKRRRVDDEGDALPRQREANADEDRGLKSDRKAEKHSKDVQRRINREIALRKRSDARLAEERARAQQLEQRLAKLERTQVDEQGQHSLRELDAKIRELVGKVAAAEEANDTALRVKLQAELADLQGQKVLMQAKIDRQREQPPARAVEPARKAEEEVPPPSGRSQDWMHQNRRWWKTERWKDARQDAITHDTTILQEIEDGELEFEAYSDEHFEELSRRLKADYPELPVRNLDGENFEEPPSDDDLPEDRRESMRRNDDGGDEQRRSPVRGSNGRVSSNGRAPMGGMGAREGRRERSEIELARHGKVQLSDEDFREMRVFKLDPNNPEHKKYFARERARTLLQQGNAGVQRR